ncbi:hypothetical protein V1478_001476 [Vespula squamosa]|uniref:Uncharacterized protein n=1 Tax=Vespula squamosa TaxID=30214 RepID=A0ABD2C229_VESSQ
MDRWIRSDRFVVYIDINVDYVGYGGLRHCVMQPSRGCNDSKAGAGATAAPAPAADRNSCRKENYSSSLSPLSSSSSLAAVACQRTVDLRTRFRPMKRIIVRKKKLNSSFYLNSKFYLKRLEIIHRNPYRQRRLIQSQITFSILFLYMNYNYEREDFHKFQFKLGNNSNEFRKVNEENVWDENLSLTFVTRTLDRCEIQSETWRNKKLYSFLRSKCYRYLTSAEDKIMLTHRKTAKFLSPVVRYIERTGIRVERDRVGKGKGVEEEGTAFKIARFCPFLETSYSHHAATFIRAMSLMVSIPYGVIILQRLKIELKRGEENVTRGEIVRKSIMDNKFDI